MQYGPWLLVVFYLLVAKGEYVVDKINMDLVAGKAIIAYNGSTLVALTEDIVLKRWDIQLYDATTLKWKGRFTISNIPLLGATNIMACGDYIYVLFKNTPDLALIYVSSKSVRIVSPQGFVFPIQRLSYDGTSDLTYIVDSDATRPLSSVEGCPDWTQPIAPLRISLPFSLILPLDFDGNYVYMAQNSRILIKNLPNIPLPPVTSVKIATNPIDLIAFKGEILAYDGSSFWFASHPKPNTTLSSPTPEITTGAPKVGAVAPPEEGFGSASQLKVVWGMFAVIGICAAILGAIVLLFVFLIVKKTRMMIVQYFGPKLKPEAHQPEMKASAPPMWDGDDIPMQPQPTPTAPALSSSNLHQGD